MRRPGKTGRSRIERNPVDNPVSASGIASGLDHDARASVRASGRIPGTLTGIGLRPAEDAIRRKLAPPGFSWQLDVVPYPARVPQLGTVGESELARGLETDDPCRDSNPEQNRSASSCMS